jgi:hypothetical protein
LLAHLKSYQSRASGRTANSNTEGMPSLRPTLGKPNVKGIVLVLTDLANLRREVHAVDEVNIHHHDCLP